MVNATNALVNTDEESDLNKIFIPIIGMIGTGITVKIKEYMDILFNRYCSEKDTEEKEDPENSREYDYKEYERDEDVDIVLNNVWEPPGVKDKYRFTRINPNNVIIEVPPGELEEITKDKDSSIYNKEAPTPKQKKINSYKFELKENGDNYADCEGIYTLTDGLINKKPIYINKEKDKFLGAVGPSGWAITAMMYLEGIKELKSVPFGGFHSGGGTLPDYGSWPNYNVTPLDESEINLEIDDGLTETVQGYVNIYREFDEAPEGGNYYFNVELKSVTSNMVYLFIRRYDKDYNHPEKYSHQEEKAVNGPNAVKFPSKIGEYGIEYEQIGITVKSAEIDHKNKKKMKSKHIGNSKCIITSAYLKDKPKNRKKKP